MMIFQPGNREIIPDIQEKCKIFQKKAQNILFWYCKQRIPVLYCHINSILYQPLRKTGQKKCGSQNGKKTEIYSPLRKTARQKF